MEYETWPDMASLRRASERSASRFDWIVSQAISDLRRNRNRLLKDGRSVDEPRDWPEPADGYSPPPLDAWPGPECRQPIDGPGKFFFLPGIDNVRTPAKGA